MKTLNDYLVSDVNEARTYNVPSKAMREICSKIYDMVQDSEMIYSSAFQEGWFSNSTIEWLLNNKSCKLQRYLIRDDVSGEEITKRPKFECEYAILTFEPNGPTRHMDWIPVLIPKQQAILKTLEMYGGGNLDFGKDACGNTVEVGDEVMCASATVCRAGKLVRATVKKITPAGKISTDQGVFDSTLCVVIKRNNKSIEF